MTTIKFITWDLPLAGPPVPCYLHDLGALVRHEQAMPTLDRPIFMVDDDRCTVVPVCLEREEGWLLVDLDGLELDACDADPLDDPRALAVVDYVELHLTHFDYEPIERIRLDAASWRAQQAPADVDPLRMYDRFGYLPPSRADDGGWIFYYCPEIIAEQTAHVDDLTFDRYLDYIAIRVQMHLTNPSMPPAELEKTIDNAFYHLGPAVAHKVTEIQMKALENA